MTNTQAPVSTPATTAATTPVATRTLSTVALVAGIVSIVFGQSFLIPVAAIVLGIIGYRQEPFGRSFAVWGIVLGAIAVFGWTIFGLVGFAIAAPFFWLGAF